ncbi:NAD-dependent epimerase/dehydratase family protein [Mucilaginibacter sp.]|uniref:NAD-dependent epimerase/dehydratase family protein n=1 Tax=Mucilaginibacter sp. TaxID=1882438 RepID=UPI000CB238A2|nr:NAD-dependent epimerase/dehydratase family protein [Mucilaginibacter sp.]PLW90958.1 MAG: UDP-glucose 4-epimerase [Mucilaginibacter sp.]PMP66371.1 MAG: UDP-glucose 4-epimerase [Mucilaginibacter sp.]HEK22377.1 NAD-dependent epimerase/dehydratase family protein [Bacteroidota bacterium]
MTTSLVTGGAGFIGSHVAKHCLALGHKVIVLDDLSGGFEDHVPEGAEFIKGSINDVELLEKLFEQHRFDYVYHLAAYAAEGLSHFIRRFNYNNNLIGSVNLINLSVLYKVKCFVFTSSIAVYGAGQLPMLESMVPQPEDPYGVAKYAVEMDLKAAHHMFGLNYVIFRPHNVYGENQNIGDKYRNVIGIFMNQIMQEKPMTIFGDGEQTRAFSYIDDVAPHIANSVNVPAAYNEVFNVGADKPYTVNQLVQVVAKELGVEPKVTHLEARKEVMHAHSDHSKAAKVFGNTKNVSLEEGISKMAAWAKVVGSRASAEFENIEIEENLPQGWTKKEKAINS